MGGKLISHPFRVRSPLTDRFCFPVPLTSPTKKWDALETDCSRLISTRLWAHGRGVQGGARGLSLSAPVLREAASQLTQGGRLHTDRKDLVYRIFDQISCRNRPRGPPSGVGGAVRGTLQNQGTSGQLVLDSCGFQNLPAPWTQNDFK